MKTLLSLVLCVSISYHAISQAIVQIAKRPGQADLYQRVQDLKGNFDVMMISIRPGYEDASAISYFRQARGAKVLSVYISNGEGDEADGPLSYPHEVAAAKREQAFRVTQSLDCDHLFLNMPDIDAASDTSKVRISWGKDTLSNKLKQTILRFRPDVIMVCSDPNFTGMSPQLHILKKDLIDVVRRIALTSANSSSSAGQWSVHRVFIDDGSGTGKRLNTELIHPFLKKTYSSIGMEAMQPYSSKSRQSLVFATRKRSYTFVYPSGLRLKRLDQGLPASITPKLRPIESGIRKLTDEVLKNKLSSLRVSTRDSYLRSLAVVMASVDRNIPMSAQFSTFEIKSLGRWKAGLENLRNALLGVSISFSFSETKLAPRQLVFLQVDTVTGIQTEGTTEIFFPGTQQRWVVNESFEQRLPLKLHEIYNLLSPPAGVSFELPSSTNGLLSERFARPFYFLVVHRSKKAEFNFVHRQAVNVFHTPKFTVEVLTPIVRLRQGEKLILRLTNHSRDGVKDSVFVGDSLVFSDKKQFRLNSKGLVWQDTLTLQPKTKARDSTYLFTVFIADDVMAHFAARSFDVRCDSAASVAVIPSFPGSAVVQTLRRMDIEPRTLALDSLPSGLERIQTLIIDRRALTFHKNIAAYKQTINSFAQGGGHVVILAQDAIAWNTSPLFEGIHLDPAHFLDADCKVAIDTTSSFFSSPNLMRSRDWENWLYRRGYNIVQLHGLPSAQIILKATVGGQDYPLITSYLAGKGRITYVDLDLNHQWLNIHEGAFRLLANLLSL